MKEDILLHGFAKHAVSKIHHLLFRCIMLILPADVQVAVNVDALGILLPLFIKCHGSISILVIGHLLQIVLFVGNHMGDNGKRGSLTCRPLKSGGQLGHISLCNYEFQADLKMLGLSLPRAWLWRRRLLANVDYTERGWRSLCNVHFRSDSRTESHRNVKFYPYAGPMTT